MPKPGPRTTYKYSEKFKATAVKLSALPGVSSKDVAESLCIHPFMLSRWRKEVREGLIVAKGIEVSKSDASELKRLRKLEKAHKRLVVEHEILKKVVEWKSDQKKTSSNSSSTTKGSSK